MNCVRPNYASLVVCKIVNHYSLRTRAVALYRYRTCAEGCCSVSCRRSTKILATTKHILETAPKCPQRLFGTSDNKKSDINKHTERVKQELKTYLEQNRERLRDTEHRIKTTSNEIFKDIKETKDKVKERVGEIIEVTIFEGFNCAIPVLAVAEGECVHDTKFLVHVEDIAVSLSGNAYNWCALSFRTSGFGYRCCYRSGKLQRQETKNRTTVIRFLGKSKGH